MATDAQIAKELAGYAVAADQMQAEGVALGVVLAHAVLTGDVYLCRILVGYHVEQMRDDERGLADAVVAYGATRDLIFAVHRDGVHRDARVELTRSGVGVAVETIGAGGEVAIVSLDATEARAAGMSLFALANAGIQRAADERAEETRLGDLRREGYSPSDLVESDDTETLLQERGILRAGVDPTEVCDGQDEQPPPTAPSAEAARRHKALGARDVALVSRRRRAARMAPGDGSRMDVITGFLSRSGVEGAAFETVGLYFREKSPNHFKVTIEGLSCGRMWTDATEDLEAAVWHYDPIGIHNAGAYQGLGAAIEAAHGIAVAFSLARTDEA